MKDVKLMKEGGSAVASRKRARDQAQKKAARKAMPPAARPIEAAASHVSSDEARTFLEALT
jgi:hypothetical protein